MKREDIDVMEAKARAALAAIPDDLRAVRWTVGNTATGTNADLLAIDLLYPDDPDCGHMLVEDTTDVLSRPTAEHIAASDPHAVLALIAELRRVEQERDEERAHAERLVAALEPVRPILRDLQRPAWDETEAARWGIALSITLFRARELAAACDAVDPEPPLRNAD